MKNQKRKQQLQQRVKNESLTFQTTFGAKQKFNELTPNDKGTHQPGNPYLPKPRTCRRFAELERPYGWSETKIGI